VGKKQPRRKVGPPGPLHFAARASGKVIVVPRVDAIARLLDTAILLWFFERDPVSIHLLAVAPYNCLEILGKKDGTGPRIKSKIGAKLFETAYDFLRHASSNPNEGMDFAPLLNGPILFDAVAAFARIFGNATMYMRTFWAYFILHPEAPVPKAREDLLKQPSAFLPEGISIDEAMKLGRIEFFTRLTKMFTVQLEAGPYPGFHSENPPK
jgi:hypothetical protein